MSAIELCRTAALGGHTEALRRLRPRPHRLQLVPQPALPEVPGAGPRRVAGRRGRPSCCRCRTSTSSSRCRRRSPRSPSRTRRRSTPSCSGPRPRRCARSPPIPSISAPRSASSPCSTPGARTCTIIRTSIASCRAAACRSDGTRWIACRPGFFLPVRVLSRLFRRLFLDELQAAFEAGELGFFGELAGLADPPPSPAGSRDCAGSSGSSMPSRPSAARPRCWPISAATPTASPSPTPAWSA